MLNGQIKILFESACKNTNAPIYPSGKSDLSKINVEITFENCCRMFSTLVWCKERFLSILLEKWSLLTFELGSFDCIFNTFMLKQVHVKPD